jgi:di/tricarboxylate transporter
VTGVSRKGEVLPKKIKWGNIWLFAIIFVLAGARQRAGAKEQLA